MNKAKNALAIKHLVTPPRSRHCIRQLALAIGLLCSVLCHASEVPAKATPQQSPSVSRFTIPSTVSPAAQALLKRFADAPIVTPPTPRTREDWLARQERYRQVYGRAGLQKALQRAEGVTIKTEDMGGVTVRTVRPASVAEHYRGRVLMHLHGGAYIYGDGEHTVIAAIPVAQAAQIEVVSVDYRMPPDHPYPTAVEDAVAVYRELLKRYRPEHIGIFGGSAGGGLAAATTLAIRDRGLPLPGALALRSPWTDLSKTGDSYHTLDGLDPILRSYEAAAAAPARLYAGNHDLKKPLISPVYGDFGPGFPPTFLLTGTRDLLLSCTVRLHRKLRQAGVEAELHVFEGMWHGFDGIAELPEAADALNEIVDFFNRQLADPQP